MARIPAEELERLKAEVSVERLAEARGVELRRKGRDLVGLCPFHEDRDPSFEDRVVSAGAVSSALSAHAETPSASR